MLRKYVDKYFDYYIEFCNANGINFLLPLLIIALLINFSYLPVLLNKKKFQAYKTSQKIIMFHSFFVTFIIILAMIFNVGSVD